MLLPIQILFMKEDLWIQSVGGFFMVHQPKFTSVGLKRSRPTMFLQIDKIKSKQLMKNELGLVKKKNIH